MLPRTYSRTHQRQTCQRKLINITYLHCCSVFHNMKSMLFIKRNVIFVFRHKFKIHKILIFFFNVFHHSACNTLSLILRMYKYIMNLCEHFRIIKDAYETDKSRIVPHSEHSLGIHKCLIQFLRIFTRFPTKYRKSIFKRTPNISIKFLFVFRHNYITFSNCSTGHKAAGNHSHIYPQHKNIRRNFCF